MEADSVERRQEELGIHILENIRNELYYYFPYLDGAFACISGKGSEQTGTIGTDGAFFLFSPEYLLKLYVKKPEAVRRGYLHMLLHCLFLHLFKPAGGNLGSCLRYGGGADDRAAGAAPAGAGKCRQKRLL